MVFAAFLIAISCIFGLIGYGLAKFFFGLTIGWFMKVLLWIFVFLLVSMILFIIVALFAGLFFLL